jgi:hypothetical protein
LPLIFVFEALDSKFSSKNEINCLNLAAEKTSFASNQNITYGKELFQQVHLADRFDPEKRSYQLRGD